MWSDQLDDVILDVDVEVSAGINFYVAQISHMANCVFWTSVLLICWVEVAGSVLAPVSDRSIHVNVKSMLRTRRFISA